MDVSVIQPERTRLLVCYVFSEDLLVVIRLFVYRFLSLSLFLSFSLCFCSQAMSFPCEGVYTLWRNDVYVVRDFLTSKYGSDWRVFNLTETAYDAVLFYGAVVHCPIPDHHAPPLMKLLDYVQTILRYLEEKPTNVAVLHWYFGKFFVQFGFFIFVVLAVLLEKDELGR